MLIRDWLYAIAVCKKYKIKWTPFVNRKHGSYNFTEGVVAVNPFHGKFISVFLHEVGHHVDHKKRNYNIFLNPFKTCLRYSDTNYDVIATMRAEGNASRFAVKTGKADKKYLVKCFNTYSAPLFKKMINPILGSQFTNIVDCVYRNTRRIEQ